MGAAGPSSRLSGMGVFAVNDAAQGLPPHACQREESRSGDVIPGPEREAPHPEAEPNQQGPEHEGIDADQ